MSTGLKCYFKAGGRPELSSSIIYVMKKKKMANRIKKEEAAA